MLQLSKASRPIAGKQQQLSSEETLHIQSLKVAQIIDKHQSGDLVVTVVGAGYVGALTAITMACRNPEVQFKVCDINRKLIDRWVNGDLPFYEPGLEAYYKEAVHGLKNVQFTTEVRQSISLADVILIAVNTPPKRQEHGPVLQVQSKHKSSKQRGSQMGTETDLSAFMSVVREIGSSFDQDAQHTYHKIIVEKSTVPVGTAVEVQEELGQALGIEYERVNEYFSTVNMPEFLAEGSAIRDLVNPQRVVIGTDNDKVFNLINNLVQGKKASVTGQDEDIKVIRTQDTASSELGKLMSNAMLAQRVSSINSLTELCELTPGCDISSVKSIVQADDRIGSKYLQCSLGFGGSCFEKDLKSLIYILHSNGMSTAAQYWQSVLDMNQHQKARLADLVIQNESNTRKKNQKPSIAVFGFSYKKNTSDTRDTPCVTVVARLAKAGFNVRVHDPEVTQSGFDIELKAQGHHILRQDTGSENRDPKAGTVQFFGNDCLGTVADCQALLVLTEWDQFQTYDYSKIVQLMAQTGTQKTLYDFRKLLTKNVLVSSPFDRSFQLGVGWLKGQQ